MTKNQIIELTITDISVEGFGIAKYNDETYSDFVIFVKNALVGDIVDCKIVKVLKHYAFGIIDRIIEASPHRISTSCSSFSKCGGCSFLNCTYEEELRIKRNNIENLFKINYRSEYPSIQSVVPSPQITNYRNKVQYPVSPDGHFSFFSKHSHRTQNIDECILHPESFRQITLIVERFISEHNISCYDEEKNKGLIRYLYIRQAPETKETMVCIVINGSSIPHAEQLIQKLSVIPDVVSIFLNINKKNTNVILGPEFIHLWGKEFITDKLCGLSLNISPDSFYQINSKQTAQLYNYVKKAAKFNKNDILLDLYCGIGTIGLICSNEVKETIGVEIIPNAIKNAERNKKLNDIENASFICGDVKNIIDNIDQKPTCIIVDPPRKGLDEVTISTIKKILPEKLIYISCNPATLTRDLGIINSEHDYNILSIVPFDMFPRTCHVETVCLLTRK